MTQGIKMNLCICAVILYNLKNHISNIYVTPWNKSSSRSDFLLKLNKFSNFYVGQKYPIHSLMMEKYGVS